MQVTPVLQEVLRVMPSEVISRMESPSQDALDLPSRCSYHFFTKVDYYHLDIKYLEPIGTLYIIYNYILLYNYILYIIY